MTNLIRSDFQAHPFHLVSPSPWPLYTSISLLTLTCSGVLTMHGFSNASYFLFLSLATLILCMSLWWRDVISEGTYLGNHTLAVQKGLNMGVALFIVSEALFFLAIFWAYFHSALSPTVELGAQWPPMGIEAVNPFELPLINTVILLSSGFTVTYAHHSLIQGNRKGTLDGLLYTIILAVIFTGFQAVEYSVSFFSISDGAFGSCFYFGTGFHGFTTSVAPNLCEEKLSNNKISIAIPDKKFKTINRYSLDKNFLEWLVGFVDAEGNFNIKITGLSGNTYKNAQFTFQIGLHPIDIKVLEYIQNNLKCGHISSSANKVNYFVNDKLSLQYVILPVFNYISLNSSKYHQFNIFKKAFSLVIDNNHLNKEGKMQIISLQKEMQNLFAALTPSTADKIHHNITITSFWLAGFVDGDGTFSTNKSKPRFKLENHIKELELYNKIKEYLGTGNMTISSVRPGREHQNKTVSLEVNSIKELKYIIIPLMNDKLRTLKLLDFKMWSHLVNIYYNGYHLLPEGVVVFNKIKLTMNKYRLINCKNLSLTEQLSLKDEIDSAILDLYKIHSPYIIKNGIRYIRGTNNLVSDINNIIVR